MIVVDILSDLSVFVEKGWVDEASELGRILGAFSHWTFDFSGGSYMVLDMQGAEYRDGIIISDPAVISIDQSFGMTDQGAAAILGFFSHHKCNHFCSPLWRKPITGDVNVDCTKGTKFTLK